MRYLLSLVFLMATLSIADAASWHRDGARPADVARAIAACKRHVAENFDEDGDYDEPTGRTPDSLRLINRERARQEMFDDCMKERGFRKGGGR